MALTLIVSGPLCPAFLISTIFSSPQNTFFLIISNIIFQQFYIAAYLIPKVLQDSSRLHHTYQGWWSVYCTQIIMTCQLWCMLISYRSGCRSRFLVWVQEVGHLFIYLVRNWVRPSRDELQEGFGHLQWLPWALFGAYLLVIKVFKERTKTDKDQCRSDGNAPFLLKRKKLAVMGVYLVWFEIDGEAKKLMLIDAAKLAAFDCSP